MAHTAIDSFENLLTGNNILNISAMEVEAFEYQEGKRPPSAGQVQGSHYISSKPYGSMLLEKALTPLTMTSGSRHAPSFQESTATRCYPYIYEHKRTHVGHKVTYCTRSGFSHSRLNHSAQSKFGLLWNNGTSAFDLQTEDYYLQQPQTMA
ncbi:hypothetical protein AMTR_s00096p00082920 [Amborella trichopoda]|uniref:Uncharacterized protein n=1 Tax=Amborella trichopoda TaxID=13333 RepID=W1P459_AMBTC|nr:hypothetical protein AMTR_s00096p00082920 [Amborella trichopoda]